ERYELRFLLVEGLGLCLFNERRENVLDCFWIMLGPLSPPERLDSHLWRRAVDADRLFDRRGRYRNQSPLEGKSEREQVGGDRIPQQRRRYARGIDGRKPVLPHPRGGPDLHWLA